MKLSLLCCVSAAIALSPGTWNKQAEATDPFVSFDEFLEQSLGLQPDDTLRLLYLGDETAPGIFELMLITVDPALPEADDSPVGQFFLNSELEAFAPYEDVFFFPRYGELDAEVIDISIAQHGTASGIVVLNNSFVATIAVQTTDVVLIAGDDEWLPSTHRVLTPFAVTANVVDAHTHAQQRANEFYFSGLTEYDWNGASFVARPWIQQGMTPGSQNASPAQGGSTEDDASLPGSPCRKQCSDEFFLARTKATNEYNADRDSCRNAAWAGGLAGCGLGVKFCSPGGPSLLGKCCIIGGVIGTIAGEMRCRDEAKNRYDLKMQNAKADYLFCLRSKCGLSIDGE